MRQKRNRNKTMAEENLMFVWKIFDFAYSYIRRPAAHAADAATMSSYLPETTNAQSVSVCGAVRRRSIRQNIECR